MRDVQLLKFGQVIDLERIESVGVNKAGEELKVRIAKVEATQEQALQLALSRTQEGLALIAHQSAQIAAAVGELPLPPPPLEL